MASGRASFLVVCGLLSATPVQAANWMYATTSNDGDVLLFDSSELRPKTDIQTLWVKRTAEKPTNGIGSSLTRYRISCSGKWYSVLAWVEYAPDMKLLRQGAVEPALAQKVPAPPDTVIEGVIAAACAKVLF